MLLCSECGFEKPNEQVRLGTCDDCFNNGAPSVKGPGFQKSASVSSTSTRSVTGICIGCSRVKPVVNLSNGVCVRCQVNGPPSDSAYTADELSQIALGKSVEPSAPVKSVAPSDIILTTSIDVPGHEIERVVQIVASEVALGMNVFKDIANNWRDFVGGRSNSAQKSLKEARSACLDELKREAAAVGADAVIAVDLDYNELSTSGGGAGILFVAASGTAVRLRSPAI